MDHRSQVAPSGVTVLSNGDLICADQAAGVVLGSTLHPTAEGHCESPRARQKVVEHTPERSHHQLSTGAQTACRRSDPDARGTRSSETVSVVCVVFDTKTA